jgi:hypothetical protein
MQDKLLWSPSLLYLYLAKFYEVPEMTGLG